MRVRLHPPHTEEYLRELYAVPHNHTRWEDHLVRVEKTIELAHALAPDPRVIADLSCGDAAISQALAGMASEKPQVILGDYAPGYEITGPIEETLTKVDHADLWIISETVEHLDDPDGVLAGIRYRSDALVLSTPLSEFDPVNPEHYWGWDHDGVRDLLIGAGWNVAMQWDVIHPLAQYQIWGCR